MPDGAADDDDDPLKSQELTLIHKPKNPPGWPLSRDRNTGLVNSQLSPLKGSIVSYPQIIQDIKGKIDQEQRIHRPFDQLLDVVGGNSHGDVFRVAGTGCMIQLRLEDAIAISFNDLSGCPPAQR